MSLYCCVQTLRRDLKKGKLCSGWEDTLVITYSGKQLWCTYRKGEDFLNLRCWKSLMGILHIFCVALGEVLWPWFCTRKEKGNVAWVGSGSGPLSLCVSFPSGWKFSFDHTVSICRLCTLGRGCPRKASQAEQITGSLLPFPGLWLTGTPPCRLALTPLQKHFEFPGQRTTCQ